MRAMLVVLLFSVLSLAGCLSDDDYGSDVDSGLGDTPAPFMGYVPMDPDSALTLVMEDLIVTGSSGNNLHVRVTRPDGAGPFPVIVQDTPYTGTGCSTGTYDQVIEPPVLTCGEGTFETQFARRGYAYVHGDLRGTGDSDGCLDLRGQADIADIATLSDALAAMAWSNGNVGFIGASYPGSTSHMAALSGSTAVKAVIPVVASTSFYHYHHNSGVPYNGNHALGGTNTGYTSEGVTPTFNPTSGLQKLIDQPMCPHVENAVEHGGLDQSGSYYDWWQERNLRPLAETVTIPVMMAQGLADWNVKPDHVKSWFNDIKSENKVFIGGQWGHAYPASGQGACPSTVAVDDEPGRAACTVPWDQWWVYATSFFDTYLKEIHTGMFEGSIAWMQDNSGTWHRSAAWPLPFISENDLAFKFLPDGSMETGMNGGVDFDGTGEEVDLTWYACPHDTNNRGAAGLSTAETVTVQCDDEPVQSLVFQTAPFAEDTILSGTPLVVLGVDTHGRTAHVTVVMDRLDANGNVIGARENYGYLNTAYEGPEGLSPATQDASGKQIIQIDLYPQEDLVRAGEMLRFTIASNDGGRSIESYEEGEIDLVFDAEPGNAVFLPTRPAELWGTRLA